MVFVIAIVAVLIFIYFNRHLENRRTAKREEMLDRKAEFLQQLLDMKKKKEENKTNSEEGER